MFFQVDFSFSVILSDLIIFYLVDLTTDASLDQRNLDDVSVDADYLEDGGNLADEERGLGRATPSRRSLRRSNGHSASASNEALLQDETELQTRPNSIVSEPTAYVKKKTSQLLNAVTGGLQKADEPLTPKLAALVESFASSDIATTTRAEIESFSQRRPEDELPNVAEEHRLLRGRRGASWAMQFRILSGRAFKNLYRDPALLTAHYLSSIGLARTHTAHLFPRCY